MIVQAALLYHLFVSTLAFKLPFSQTGLTISCSSGLYLDAATMSCVSCGPNQVLDASNKECSCSSGYQLIRNTSSLLQVSYTCSQCGNGTKTSSSDRSFCLGCSGSACSGCGGSQVPVDRDQLGGYLSSVQCMSCPSYGYPNYSGTGCIFCPETIMVAVKTNGAYSCTCPPPYNAAPINGSCIDSNLLGKINLQYPSGNVGLLSFGNLVSSSGATTSVTVKSDVINAMFSKAAVKCQYEQNHTACQSIANMCVLSDYDDTSAACSLYIFLARSYGSGNTDFLDWPFNLPWLYYGLLSSEDATTTLSKPFTLTYQVYPRINSNTIKFVLSKYALDGSFLGFEYLQDQLQFCAIDPVSKLDYLQAGQIFDNSCSINLMYLVSQFTQAIFYELYILDNSLNLYPVPVRIYNIKKGGVLVNTDLSVSSLNGVELVRRFLLLDTISTQPSTGGNPSIVKIADYISLFIPMSGNGNQFTVGIPHLTIRYSERYYKSLSLEDRSTVSSVPVQFKTVYQSQSSINSFWSTLTAIFITICVILALLWAFESGQWSRKSQRANETLSLQVLIGWSFLASRMSYHIFGLLTYLGAFYWFLGFKGQADYLVLAPTDSFTISVLNTILYIMLACTSVTVCYLILLQCNADIFFIDWEKSRGKLLSHGDEEIHKPAPVSMWRTVFVTREWCELQTSKAVPTEAVLVLLLVFLVGLDLRSSAVPYPTVSSKAIGSPNPILLFFINTSGWLCIYFGLYVIRRFIYDRFYSNKLLQFIDLLSMSNISMFILDCMFHGYYVHGRSVHPFADTDMADMSSNLEKEERGLVAKRGLNGSDNQTFEIFITQSFRSLYDKIYNVFIYGSRVRNALSQNNLAVKSHGHARSVESGIIKSHETINKLLCNFVENNLKENLFHVRKYTVWERCASAAPQLLKDSCFLIDEAGNAFSKVLVRGIELDLFLLYVYIYNVIDISTDKPWLSLITVFFVDLLLMAFRRHFGRKNVAQKTLVDIRFLV